MPPPGGAATPAASAAAHAAAATTSTFHTTQGAGRARLGDPAPAGADAMINRLAQGKPPAAATTATAAAPGGGGGKRMVAAAAPALAGSKVVAVAGAWGGEMRALLKRAGCEKHLAMFQREMVDMEVLTMMRDKDFHKMGLNEVCVCLRRVPILKVRALTLGVVDAKSCRGWYSVEWK